MRVEEIYERVHPGDRPRMRQSALDVIKGVISEYHEEYRIRSATGQWVWVQSRGKVVERDERGRALRMTGTNADVRQRRQAEQHIRYLATRDALTDLPKTAHPVRPHRAGAGTAAQRDNGRGPRSYTSTSTASRAPTTRSASTWETRCCARWRRGSRVVLRKEDSLARKGSDEIRRVLPRLSGQREAASLAYKVLAAVQRPFEIEGHSLHVSGQHRHRAVPVRRARRRHAAQERGHRDVSREASGRQQGPVLRRAHARAGTASASHRDATCARALARDEFTLHYQPLFELATDEAVGVEALLRWNNPTLGAVLPRDFIPVAEDSGLIVQHRAMGAGGSAARQARRWQRRGDTASCASRSTCRCVSFGERAFPTPCKARSREAAWRARHLELEITGKRAHGAVAEVDRRARGAEVGLGVRMSIDDFGTGHLRLELPQAPARRTGSRSTSRSCATSCATPTTQRSCRR